MAIVQEKELMARVWNKELADLLHQLDANSRDLAARTSLLCERLDTHTRRLGLSPVAVTVYSRKR